jgi:predicted transcriptional regulator
MLGGLEQKIMDSLWSSAQPLKPADIVKVLNHSHAYTTITTILKRMHDKGLVHRTQQGNVFFYHPVMDKTTYACSCLDDLFIRLFDSYGAEVVSAFRRVAKSEHML